MIEQNVHQNQLPNEIKSAFKELKVLQHLKTAGFKKRRNSGIRVHFYFNSFSFSCFITKTGFACSKAVREQRFLEKTPCIVS